ncbi:putative transcription factor PosF21 [Ananas comosus]|uniref:BZIP domain-containing protein n=2 Tax=Ananas comosus TaxID=4615 RepID=A0A6V7QV26_ANACO|nr:putative transcription factor PosF21 [Ananas comosus]
MMNKDKSPVQGGGAGVHYAAYGSPSGGFAPMADPSPPSSSSSAHAGHDEAGRYSHDISRMPDFPPRNRGHRRAQSEILSLPDDITFDSDLGFVGSHDGPSLSDENDDELFSMFIDVEKLNFATSEGESSGNVVAPHLPTTTAAAAAAAAAASGAVAAWPSEAESSAAGSRERPRPRHQHSQSMDGSTSIKPELLGSSGEGPMLADAKKAMSAAKLADLALVDPKRAKRIWANRQSAARSKERKLRYIAELERKVQALQTEATTLSAQLTLLQRDTTGLTAENNELKLRLQTMEQQVHLQDALNDALRDEVQRLKHATGQMPNGGAAAMMNFAPPHSFGTSQQFYHHNQAMQSILTARQLQQLQIHSQHQQPPPLQHPPQHLHLQDPLANPRMKGSSSSSSSSLSQRAEGKSDSNST